MSWTPNSDRRGMSLVSQPGESDMSAFIGTRTAPFAGSPFGRSGQMIMNSDGTDTKYSPRPAAGNTITRVFSVRVPVAAVFVGDRALAALDGQHEHVSAK